MKLLVKTIIVFSSLLILYIFYCHISSDNRIIIQKCENDNYIPMSYQINNSDNDTILQEIDKSLRNFITREGLKGGASVAISYHGHLVYAKGIGYANIEDSIEMQPYNVMRIASVSKLITATAVMKLVEEGKIDLHQKVFGKDGILNNDEYRIYKDKRMEQVTVYQLLNHSGGWTSRWGDPMFMPHSIATQMGKKLPINMKDIIRFMQTKSMHFNPGTASIYSNFGYGILGEVVSKAAAMPYEDYVKSKILYPLGIFDMQIGHSHKTHRLSNEAIYYELDTAYTVMDYTNANITTRKAYGGTDIQTLGAAGGWVASATDLLKLVLTIDGNDNVVDQLSKESIDTMTTTTESFDPLGWRSIVNDSWYRTGTLAATSAIIARCADSLNYVVILNCSNYKGPHLANVLKNEMNNAVAKVKNWPNIDLFAEDKKWQSYINSAKY